MKSTTILAALAAYFLATASLAAPVNINTASAPEIAEALHGVGLAKAQAIVAYREANGVFSRADEIVFVRGIGEATFERNKGDILVK